VLDRAREDLRVVVQEHHVLGRRPLDADLAAAAAAQVALELDQLGAIGLARPAHRLPLRRRRVVVDRQQANGDPHVLAQRGEGGPRARGLVPGQHHHRDPRLAAAVEQTLRQLRQARLDLAAKTAVEQQVLGRVSGQGQLGKQHQVRAELRACAARAADDP